MANLIEAAAELEYVPKDQLAQMVNNPDAGYPSYLVLSEIQRRTLLEKAYNAERVAMEKPSTTVAEEVVSNFVGGPQGLAGGAQDLAGGPQGLAGVPPSSSEITSSGGMPALMAQGGRTGYQEGGSPEERGGSPAWYSFRDPDGSINWTKAGLTGLTAASLFSPIGWGARGLWAGMKGLPALAGRFGAGYAKKVSEPIGKFAFNLMSPKMQNAYIKRMTAEGAKYAGKKSVPLKALGSALQRRAVLAGGIGGIAYASGLGDGDIEGIKDDQRDVGNGLTSESGDSVPRGSETGFDPYDMARMGFALMGARDTSELAKGLSGISKDIQTRKREAPLVEAQLQEIQAKVNYYNSQGEYNKADQLYKLASTLSAQITAMMESNNIAGATEAAKRLAEVNNAYSLELGIEPSQQSDASAIDAATVQ